MPVFRFAGVVEEPHKGFDILVDAPTHNKAKVKVRKLMKDFGHPIDEIFEGYYESWILPPDDHDGVLFHDLDFNKKSSNDKA